MQLPHLPASDDPAGIARVADAEQGAYFRRLLVSELAEVDARVTEVRDRIGHSLARGAFFEAGRARAQLEDDEQDKRTITRLLYALDRRFIPVAGPRVTAQRAVSDAASRCR
ncbi:hypothetical protein Mycch_5521 (plasmid) [Mycolicibacterium chubuense NBB4]|uniref:Uncharacterized protein n=2 Tax=Mycolicibacterium TaxID=1866885 RepID=I4BSC9_MYCCN|nr:MULTISPECIES: hypothetical protein [Mycolicibacterium]AFM20186.1 hypothetical protein Mycch_5521 [Mycolicibacterium chubuense NBB4]KMO70757.1 hypothetical protein MCHLDSM_05650 [Mycolicibacterium chlorophenolicum]